MPRRNREPETDFSREIYDGELGFPDPGLPLEVTVGIGCPDSDDLVSVRVIVNTDFPHSVLPESLLRRLHLQPRYQIGGNLSGGSRVKYGYGLAMFSIGGDERPCPVIFGAEHDYVLGSSTLEIFNLVVDETGESLRPVTWLPLGWGGQTT